MDKQTEQARNRLHRLLTVVNIPKSLADAHNEMGRLSDEIERLREGLQLIECEPINAEYMARNILDGLPAYHGTMLECTENCKCKVGAGDTAVQGDMLLPANVGANRAAEGGPVERPVMQQHTGV